MWQAPLIIFLSCVIAACSNSAANMAEGIQCFKAQNYRTAFIRLKPEALKGQPDAQYAVGYMYYYGRGVVENRKQAWFWINMAAKVGQHDAVIAARILQEGSVWKQDLFLSKKLQHFPAVKEMY